ncbi:MAG: SH3 domain-containing protein [Lachnospiraceae bacterium]
MTKLGKTAAAAMKVACLSGCFVLANPYTVHAAELVNTSRDSVSLNQNREVAGLAAVMSGDFTFKFTDTQNAESSSVAEESSDANQSETADGAVEVTAAAEEEKTVLTANVDNSLNIRQNPSEDAEIAGKLFRGCTAEVVSENEGWYEITSGDVTGWVSKEYTKTGSEAEALLTEINPSVATVTAKTLNLREQASTKSDVVSVLDKDSSFMVLSADEEWVHVRYTTNLDGYVSAEYVTVTEGAGQAVSTEVLKAYAEMADEKEAERVAAEEAARAAEAAKKAEAEKKAAEAAKKTAAKATTSAKKTSSSSSSSVSADNVTLLAAICEYEAGTNYDGCVAVANVVLNRVRSSKYPGSIKAVIYQKGQFGNVANGGLNKILNRGPKSTCIKAAKAALAGTNNVGSRLQFRSARTVNPSSYKNSVVIGGNCFF